MLKYLYCKEIFKEIPNEITLGISISGCQIHCYGCHSRELWEDKGKELTTEELSKLLEGHKGITCVCLFGGEHNLDYLLELLKFLHGKIKTAWYSGLYLIPKQHQNLLKYLDFLKLGPYKAEFGGLNNPKTNQKFYKIEHMNDDYNQIDITHEFWNKHINYNEEKNKSIKT